MEERERYLSPGSCCFGVVWRAAPGCWGSVCGPGCRRWGAGPQPTGAAQFGGRAKWLSYPGGCEHTQQAWTYLHLWRHGNLMDRKHEAHLASDLLYLYYQMCVCICTVEPSSTARAAVAFDRRASWRAMNETDWNHAGCKTRWNVFCFRLQLISQTCSVESPVFTFLLLLMLLGFCFCFFWRGTVTGIKIKLKNILLKPVRVSLKWESLGKWKGAFLH